MRMKDKKNSPHGGPWINRDRPRGFLCIRLAIYYQLSQDIACAIS